MKYLKNQFQCEFCQKQFSWSDALNRHCKTCNTGSPPPQSAPQSAPQLAPESAPQSVPHLKAVPQITSNFITDSTASVKSSSSNLRYEELASTFAGRLTDAQIVNDRLDSDADFSRFLQRCFQQLGRVQDMYKTKAFLAVHVPSKTGWLLEDSLARRSLACRRKPGICLGIRPTACENELCVGRVGGMVWVLDLRAHHSCEGRRWEGSGGAGSDGRGMSNLYDRVASSDEGWRRSEEICTSVSNRHHLHLFKEAWTRQIFRQTRSRSVFTASPVRRPLHTSSGSPAFICIASNAPQRRHRTERLLLPIKRKKERISTKHNNKIKKRNDPIKINPFNIFNPFIKDTMLKFYKTMVYPFLLTAVKTGSPLSRREARGMLVDQEEAGTKYEAGTGSGLIHEVQKKKRRENTKLNPFNQIDTILNPPEEIKHVVLYSDSCPGQNKITPFLDMCLYVLQEKKIDMIDHKLMVPGHTKKHSKIISHPHDWAQLIRITGKKKPFNVIELAQEDFCGYASLLRTDMQIRKSNEDGEKFLKNSPAAVYPPETVTSFRGRHYEGWSRGCGLFCKPAHLSHAELFRYRPTMLHSCSQAAKLLLHQIILPYPVHSEVFDGTEVGALDCPVHFPESFCPQTTHEHQMMLHGSEPSRGGNTVTSKLAFWSGQYAAGRNALKALREIMASVCDTRCSSTTFFNARRFVSINARGLPGRGFVVANEEIMALKNLNGSKTEEEKVPCTVLLIRVQLQCGRIDAASAAVVTSRGGITFTDGCPDTFDHIVYTPAKLLGVTGQRSAKDAENTIPAQTPQANSDVGCRIKKNFDVARRGGGRETSLVNEQDVVWDPSQPRNSPRTIKREMQDNEAAHNTGLFFLSPDVERQGVAQRHDVTAYGDAFIQGSLCALTNSSLHSSDIRPSPPFTTSTSRPPWFSYTTFLPHSARWPSPKTASQHACASSTLFGFSSRGRRRGCDASQAYRCQSFTGCYVELIASKTKEVLRKDVSVQQLCSLSLAIFAQRSSVLATFPMIYHQSGRIVGLARCEGVGRGESRAFLEREGAADHYEDLVCPSIFLNPPSGGSERRGRKILSSQRPNPPPPPPPQSTNGRARNEEAERQQDEQASRGLVTLIADERHCVEPVNAEDCFPNVSMRVCYGKPEEPRGCRLMRRRSSRISINVHVMAVASRYSKPDFHIKKNGAGGAVDRRVSQGHYSHSPHRYYNLHNTTPLLALNTSGDTRRKNIALILNCQNDCRYATDCSHFSIGYSRLNDQTTSLFRYAEAVVGYGISEGKRDRDEAHHIGFRTFCSIIPATQYAAIFFSSAGVALVRLCSNGIELPDLGSPDLCLRPLGYRDILAGLYLHGNWSLYVLPGHFRTWMLSESLSQLIAFLLPLVVWSRNLEGIGPSQHSLGLISENHGKSKPGWPDWESNPGPPKCESSKLSLPHVARLQARGIKNSMLAVVKS
ncbi:hypothetical protein PR048_010364 [Dryococelus australis]|uniref:C2H2-type domain-containing protein n=1 Tax=Dryococelus australis TaxID=614101 RepID=A0ABQ9I2I3_9NEOP|nr:hypothetical protein PR048_010364 [Dryococelus australis]